MGSIRVGPLPRTRQWRQVVALIGGGAGAAAVATATAAADRWFRAAADDAGVVESV